MASEEEPNSYDAIFPSLPSSSGNVGLATNWPNESNISKLQVKRHTVTQVFHVPVEERRTDLHQEFGLGTTHRCETVAQRYGVKVEICCSKDQSLHIVITGVEDKVLEAKRAIISEIQTEKKFQYKVPRELHKYIIGSKGTKLKELQEVTCTSITVPKPDANSDIIVIQGPKDGIDRAVHEIQSICDEQSKTGFERLKIPKIYHPWIRGPHSETLTHLMESTGAKVNMPPLDIDKDEITVTGDKEKVDLACVQIMKIVKQKEQVGIRKVEFQITKSQHRFIIGKSGQTVQDIFKDFDVYVLVPRADLNSETITLFGEDSKIGAALTQVYAKANSIIIVQMPAPTWLHRYIIGDHSSNISKITADYSGTHVKFDDNKITLEGPPDEIEKLKERLNNILKELQQKLTYSEINIAPKFFGHIIGKNHENATRMQNEYGVYLRLTPENSDQPSVRIEGSEEGVQKAKHEIEELLKRLENERSKDIIIDQKYHSNLIGQGGKNIAEIRSKFNGVNISIPNADKKSDIITVRGNKAEVERCCKHIQQLVKDLEESNYKDELHIFKNFHKMIIGKQGNFIRKIKDETNTRIDVPADNSDSDTIVITGKKENVIKARKLIEDKVKELIKIEEDHIDVPHNLHNALIGRSGAIIKEVRKNCGGCMINFPPEGSTSDRIVLKGPREDIEKAKEELLKIVKHRNELSYSEDVHAKLEYHRYLVGRKGNNINQVRDKYNVRVIFPQSDGNNNNTNVDGAETTTTTTTTNSNANNDVITIYGKEENVKKARAELEAMIKNLDELVNDEVEVDSKWHKNFTNKRGKLINKISSENCNVNISFPKTGNMVALKGPKEAVQAVKKKIVEIVYELEHQVTIEVVIPQKHHVAVIGKKGLNSQKISEDFHVELIFPAKLNKDANQQQQGGGAVNGFESHNGEGDFNDQQQQQVNGDNAGSSPSKFDVVLISGLKENCEKAKAALLDLVPISENIDFPIEYHRFLLDNKAEFLRDINIKYNVQTVVPKKEDNVNYITLVGTKVDIDSTRDAFKEKLEQCEAERKDRELKNFTLEFEIKPEYIQLLRGKQGVEAKKLGDKFGVFVSFSRKGEPVDKVIIKGYEENALKAKEEILRKVNELDSKVTDEVQIDSRVHSRIIGAQGKALKKIMDKYKVEIKFPGRGSASNDIIVVIGDSEDSVEDAIDYLKNLEEEYLQDVVDRLQYVHPSRQHEEDNKPQSNPKGFVVKGAPWERNSSQQTANNNQASAPAPDTNNMDDFPTITSAVGTETASSKATWGPSRR